MLQKVFDDKAVYVGTLQDGWE